jgi:glycosyltransferase involved in cell wall biosynthesis
VTVSRLSILICTYNRARLLRETLAAIRALDMPERCEVEVLIVDNNSVDNTRLVIEESARDSAIPMLHLHEPRQGKSFALNRGLAEARGDVIALTDDDVLPARQWITGIVEAFRTHEITFVFGKVRPRWGSVPPPELLTRRAQDIWGPLAIVDYGDTQTQYRAESAGQRLPIGANLALARSALVAVGGWRTDLGKVNNTLISGEDHEIFLRLRRHGLYAGFYDPAVSVKHFVPPARLTRRYFRQWFFWHGKTEALMLQDLFPDLDLTRVPRIAGAPRFIYRQALGQAARYLRRMGRSDALGLLIEELKLLQYLGLLTACWGRRLRRQREAVNSSMAAPGLLGR